MVHEFEILYSKNFFRKKNLKIKLKPSEKRNQLLWSPVFISKPLQFTDLFVSFKCILPEFLQANISAYDLMHILSYGSPKEHDT